VKNSSSRVTDDRMELTTSNGQQFMLRKWEQYFTAIMDQID
jgi:hypothetical protein